MKKIIIIAASLCSCIAVNAQNIWVSAGYLNAAAKSTTTLGSVSSTDTNNAAGFFVGAEYEMPFSDLFSVAAGLNAEFLSKKENDSKYTNIGLNIPVLARVGYSFGDFRAFANVGPNFYFGLKDTIYDETLDLTYNSYEDDYSRFELGAVIGAGIVFSDQYRFTVNYIIGLNDSCKIDKTTCKTNVLSIGFGYRF